MSKALDELRDALYGTTLVQPLSHEGRGGSLSVLCRQSPGQERAWIQLVDTMLSLTAHWPPNKLHVCRRYVLKDERMAFGWHIGIEAKSAAELVEAVRELSLILANGPKIAKTLEKTEAISVPVAPKKYVSPYADKTPQSIKEGLAEDGTPVGSSASPREVREFDSGPDPVAPKGAQPPSLRIIATGTDDKGGRTTIEEMPLPHTYRDFNKPKPGKTRGAYGGSGVGSGRPLGE